MGNAGEIEAENSMEPSDEANSLQERIRLLEESLALAEARCRELMDDRAWKLVKKFRRLAQLLVPPGSKRYQICQSLGRGFRGRPRRNIIKPPPAPKAPLPAAVMQALEGKDHRPIILFPPSIPWTSTLFQRHQHLARAWAQEGYRVIYDCTGTSENLEGWRELEPNLYLYRGPQELLLQLPEVILWASTSNLPYARSFGNRARLVYDWINDLVAYPQDQRWVQKLHRQGLLEADVVVSVSRRLHETAQRVRSDAIYLPNAVEYQRFARWNVPITEDPEFEWVLAQGRPVAGYYGALTSCFDYELLRQVARARRDWSFVLIGPNFEDALTGQPLLQEPNVTWLGSRPYEDLPSYLKGFDVALLPIVLNHLTRATSPLKLYEFFAAGKPVISTALPECQAHPQVFIGKTAEDFIRHLDQALAASRDPKYRENLRAEGERHSWEARLATVRPALEAKIGSARLAA